MPTGNEQPANPFEQWSSNALRNIRDEDKRRIEILETINAETKPEILDAFLEKALPESFQNPPEGWERQLAALADPYSQRHLFGCLARHADDRLADDLLLRIAEDRLFTNADEPFWMNPGEIFPKEESLEDLKNTLAAKQAARDPIAVSPKQWLKLIRDWSSQDSVQNRDLDLTLRRPAGNDIELSLYEQGIGNQDELLRELAKLDDKIDATLRLLGEGNVLLGTRAAHVAQAAIWSIPVPIFLAAESLSLGHRFTTAAKAVEALAGVVIGAEGLLWAKYRPAILNEDFGVARLSLSLRSQRKRSQEAEVSLKTILPDLGHIQDRLAGVGPDHYPDVRRRLHGVLSRYYGAQAVMLAQQSKWVHSKQRPLLEGMARADFLRAKAMHFANLRDVSGAYLARAEAIDIRSDPDDRRLGIDPRPQRRFNVAEMETAYRSLLDAATIRNKADLLTSRPNAPEGVRRGDVLNVVAGNLKDDALGCNLVRKRLLELRSRPVTPLTYRGAGSLGL
jgi:hypothetical protein